MDLDDLKDRWQAEGLALDSRLRLNPLVVQMATLGKAESALRRLSLGVWTSVLLDALLLLPLGSFLARHVLEPKYFVPGLVLHLAVIGYLAAGIRQLVGLHRVDFLAPLLRVQTRLARLRAERLRVLFLTFLVAPLLWTPLLIVGVKGLLGLDPYKPGVTELTWTGACGDVPAGNGVDAWFTKLPEGAGDGLHAVTYDGDLPLGEWLAYSYDKDCQPLTGGFALYGETTPIPAGAAYVAFLLVYGGGASFDVTISEPR